MQDWKPGAWKKTADLGKALYRHSGPGLIAAYFGWQSLRAIPEDAMTRDFGNAWGMAFHSTGRTIAFLIALSLVLWILSDLWWPKAIKAGRWLQAKWRRWIPKPPHFAVSVEQPLVRGCGLHGEHDIDIMVRFVGRGVAQKCRARITCLWVPTGMNLIHQGVYGRNLGWYERKTFKDEHRSLECDLPADGAYRTLRLGRVDQREGRPRFRIADEGPVVLPLESDCVFIGFTLHSASPRHTLTHCVVEVKMKAEGTQFISSWVRLVTLSGTDPASSSRASSRRN